MQHTMNTRMPLTPACKQLLPRLCMQAMLIINKHTPASLLTCKNSSPELRS
jgi:hypothetical protein